MKEFLKKNKQNILIIIMNTFWLVLGIIIGVWLVSLTIKALNLPDVHMSYSKGKCVEVINYRDTNYTCSNLPPRYNVIWVK